VEDKDPIGDFQFLPINWPIGPKFLTIFLQPNNIIKLFDHSKFKVFAKSADNIINIGRLGHIAHPILYIALPRQPPPVIDPVPLSPA
jgi:hypothetical protein